MAYGIGGGLADFGQGQQREALGALSQAADMEARRESENKALEESARAGKAQLGSQLGAMAGFAYGGPVGAVIGGVVGALGSDLFD
jgi:hypothetical protein